jgi:ferredoxin
MRRSSGERGWVGRAIAQLDAALDRTLGWAANPLYQSGAIAVLALLLMLATGLYLLLFYQVAAPYESVATLQAQAVGGRWVRALHRYAADLAVAAAVVHALRMALQRRTFGPRALAWLSGLVLLALLFVSGWTGYVMVWDAQARLLAAEGARLLDALPIFSEPLSRAFTGEQEPPAAFFFLNLFAHVAVPVGMAGLVFRHVARLARPRLLPPRGLALGVTALAVGLGFAWPAPLPPRADPFVRVERVPLDLFYAFWLPLSRSLAAGPALLGIAAAVTALAAVPLLSRPRRALRAAPSHVDPDLCTDCGQCAEDCPFTAIEMRPYPHGPFARAAYVDPERCVSCGICAGSCAPMAVGPPEHTGRAQLARARAFLRETPSRDALAIACVHAASGIAGVCPVPCAGNLHTSVIELLLRGGVAGVLVVSCPPRDCPGREGPRWLAARLDDGREAELHERVDRRRIRVVYAGAGESARVQRELVRFQGELTALGHGEVRAEAALPECEAARARSPA